MNEHNRHPLPPTVLTEREFDGYGRIVVRNLYWHEKVVYVDGYCFVSCRFDSCRLITNIRNYVLDSCHLSADCTVQMP